MNQRSLQRKLKELESKLYPIFRSPHPHHHHIDVGDARNKLEFLKARCSAEVSSQPENSDKLRKTARKIATLDAAFDEWEESRNDIALDDMSVCSECTHTRQHDGEKLESESYASVLPDDSDGEKMPDNCPEDGEKRGHARKFGKYCGFFCSGTVVGAVLMRNISSMFDILANEAFRIPPT